jgi:hypothetical protein
MPKTTIIIESVTRERLKQEGHKGQTYDELINSLIEMKRNLDLPDSRFERLQSSKSMNP